MVFPLLAIPVGILMANQLQQTIPPFARSVEYMWNKRFPNAEYGVSDAINLFRKGRIDEEKYAFILKKHGINKDRALELIHTNETLLNAGDLLTLKWRGEIDEDAYIKRMFDIGYSKQSAEDFATRSLFYPGPQDLVTFQAKEVYEPDLIKSLGLDAELDSVEKEPFFKAGMTEEQIRNYWIAHWQHPSWLAVREMFWRGVVQESDVKQWFKLTEVPPFWREKLLAVANTPYTRVDVRRMYNLGVLDREDVKRSYKDIGYNDERAENLTLFTELNALPAERDLTRAMILKALNEGIIDRETTANHLFRMGYSEDESDLIILLEEEKISDATQKDVIGTIKTQYKNGIISKEHARVQFDTMNLDSAYRDRLVSELIREKEKVFKLPSKEDIIKWFTSELIDEDEFKSYMDRIGFQTPEIDIYVKQISIAQKEVS